MPAVRKPTRSTTRQTQRQNAADGFQMFEYSALDVSQPHIRLFKLLPKRKDEYLRLELYNDVPLQQGSGLRFRALSYEWGPPKPRRGVLVNGKIFLIRKNLYLFLEHLLAHFSGVRLQHLWADAICIDQESVTERNHQVRQMSEIYGQALEVLAWTGVSSPADGDLFEAMNRCLSEQDRWGNNREPSPDDWGIFWEPLRTHSKHYATFLAFCHRSYWSRLWIVQEIILAKKARIICGSHDIGIEAWCRFWESQTGTRENFGDGEELMEYKSYDTRETLLGAINAFKHLKCAEPHDKVFALSGISKAVDNVAVDYAMPIPKLFLTTVQTFGVDDSLENILGLASALKITVIALQDRLQLDTAAGGLQHSSSHALAWLEYPVNVQSHRSSRGVAKRESKAPFRWLWDKLPSVHAFNTPNKAKIRLAMCDKRCRCTCRLCHGNIRKQSPTVEYLDSCDVVCMPAIQGRTEIGGDRDDGGFYMFFKGQSYVATILDLDPHNHIASSETLLRLQDPFWPCWRLEKDIALDEVFENGAPGEEAQQRPVSIPLISVMILFMHVLQKVDFYSKGSITR